MKARERENIRKLEKTDLDLVCGLLGEALVDDPRWVYLFDDKAKRVDFLLSVAVMPLLDWIISNEGEMWGSFNKTAKLKEVIVTVPPGVSAKIPMTTMISTGIKTFTKFGVTQAKKISKYYKNLAKFINENKPKNCILIMYLVCDITSVMMVEHITELFKDADEATVPVWVYITDPNQSTVLEALGFDLQAKYSPSAPCPPAWSYIRLPQSASKPSAKKKSSGSGSGSIEEGSAGSSGSLHVRKPKKPAVVPTQVPVATMTGVPGVAPGPFPHPMYTYPYGAFNPFMTNGGTNASPFMTSGGTTTTPMPHAVHPAPFSMDRPGSIVFGTSPFTQPTLVQPSDPSAFVAPDPNILLTNPATPSMVTSTSTTTSSTPTTAIPPLSPNTTNSTGDGDSDSPASPPTRSKSYKHRKSEPKTPLVKSSDSVSSLPVKASRSKSHSSKTRQTIALSSVPQQPPRPHAPHPVDIPASLLPARPTRPVPVPLEPDTYQPLPTTTTTTTTTATATTATTATTTTAVTTVSPRASISTPVTPTTTTMLPSTATATVTATASPTSSSTSTMSSAGLASPFHTNPFLNGTVNITYPPPPMLATNPTALSPTDPTAAPYPGYAWPYVPPTVGSPTFDPYLMQPHLMSSPYMMSPVVAPTTTTTTTPAAPVAPEPEVRETVVDFEDLGVELDMSEIRTLLGKYSVEFEKIKNKEQIKLFGWDLDEIMQAKNALLKYQAKLVRESSQISPSVPSHWTGNLDTNFSLVSLDQYSAEWKKVESRVKETIPNARVSKIERVQNKWLWNQYRHNCQVIAAKNGSVNELELFHGTRNTAPNAIYLGEDGFDMRFSASGMWGIAIYFAQYASYSNSYAYKSGKKKQFFLAKVLVGDSIRLPSDGTLRLPPEKKNSGTKSDLKFATTRYDSVNGVTGGSTVYMLYTNHRAYPEWLITYED